MNVPAVAQQPAWWRKRRVIWLAIMGGFALLAVILAVFYRGHLRSGYHWIVEATGSDAAAWAALALALVALIVALLWMLLPAIVYLGFRGLRRQLAESNLTAAPCSRPPTPESSSPPGPPQDN